VTNLLAVHQNMDDKTAYAITKALFENVVDLVRVHAEAVNIKLENQKTENSSIPWHPGAIKYLAERGIKIDQAISLTKQAVALKPENGYFVDSLGWAFYKSGMLTEALTEIKKAVALAGDDPVIYEHLGEIYWKQQQMSEAREAWLRSIALDPKNTKLIERFKAQGMGDPLEDDRVRQALQRVSERVSPPSANP